MESNLPPSGRVLRRYLTEVLVTDTALNSFCLDYYPAVHQSFTNGMERQAKFDLLVGRAEVVKLLRDVQESDPERARRFAYLLRPTTPDPEQQQQLVPPTEQVYSREELLDRLCHVLPLKFEEILFLMGLNPAEAAPETQPQKRRAIELIRQAEQKGEPALKKLSALLSAP